MVGNVNKENNLTYKHGNWVKTSRKREVGQKKKLNCRCKRKLGERE